jgi:hypothetical protein
MPKKALDDVRGMIAGARKLGLHREVAALEEIRVRCFLPWPADSEAVSNRRLGRWWGPAPRHWPSFRALLAQSGQV